MIHWVSLSLTTALLSPLSSQNGPVQVSGWSLLLVMVAIMMLGVLWMLWDEAELGESQLSLSFRPKATNLTEVPPALEADTSSLQPDEAAAWSLESDDLKQLADIHEEIGQLLNERGAFSFEQLADTDVAFIEARLNEPNGSSPAPNPSTWLERARKLAAEE